MGHRQFHLPPEETPIPELERLLLTDFTGQPRPVPERPPHSRTSTVIIRKHVLPFYYAIFDHALHRFVELQYRFPQGSYLRTCNVPGDQQPPDPEQERAGSDYR